MRTFLRSRRARWAVPTAVATGIAAAVGGGAMLAGASSPDLPDKSPAELIAEVHAVEPQPFSGTVVQTSRLGLPELPGLNGDRHETSLMSMLTGSNTARVWYSSPEQARFALMGAFDEVNVIRNGSDVWAWYSSSNTADHITLPDDVGVEDRGVPHGPVAPPEAAALLLGQLAATTDITVDGTAEVAGRAAYELVVAPREEGSLIDDVRLFIDAETSMGLRLEINARGAEDPAFEMGFTSVTFTEPSADVFRFNPPPGAEVTEQSLADLFATEHDKKDGFAPSGEPTIIGESWLSVLALPGVAVPEDLADIDGMDSTDGTAMLDALLGSGTAVSGPYGTGLLFETALVSVLWLDDGTLLVGAVTPAVLEAAAAEVAR